MLDTILNGLPTFLRYWIWCGIGCGVLLVALEIAVANHRGHDPAQMETSDSKKGGILKGLAIWLCLWPIVFLLWVRAGLKGKTLMESVAEKAVPKESSKLSPHQIKYRIRSSSEDCIWLVSTTPKYSGVARIILSEDELWCTHFLWRAPGASEKGVAFRVGCQISEDSKVFPESEAHPIFSGTTEQCQDWCQKDTAWNALCTSKVWHEDRALFLLDLFPTQA